MTVRTDWRERMDCTFEAIERVMLARYDDFKCFVVFVFANFALSHPTNPSRAASVSAVSSLFCNVEKQQKKVLFLAAPLAKPTVSARLVTQRRKPPSQKWAGGKLTDYSGPFAVRVCSPEPMRSLSV